MDDVDTVRDMLVEAGREGIEPSDIVKRIDDIKDVKHAINAVYRMKDKYPEMRENVATRENNGQITYVYEDYENDEMWDAISEMSNIKRKQIPQRQHGDEVVMSVPDYMNLVIIGDTHIGNQFVDYDGLKEACKIIGDAPNTYVIFMGDLIDNSINTHSPQGTHNIIDKNDQIKMVFKMLDWLGDSVIRMISANHELRSFISDRFLPSKYIAEMYEWRSSDGKVYGRYAEPFVVKVGDRPFKIFTQHKGKGYSQYNPLHKCIRAPLFDRAEQAHDADILVTAHTHEKAQGSWTVGGKERTMVVPDCHVEWSHYAERVGMTSGTSGLLKGIHLREDEEPTVFKDFRFCLKVSESLESE